MTQDTTTVPSPGPGGMPEMTPEQIAALPPIVRIAIGVGRAFGTLNEELAHKFIAPEFVDHEASEGVGGGPDGYLATARYMHSAFSDAQWRPDDMFFSGDRYAVRVTFSGVHTGDFLGVAPTGKRVEVQHLHFYRVAGGKVVEHWGARDELTLLRQIGVFTPVHPTPADAAVAAAASA
jgi:predicted ester cyclase